jgi:tetratricopeptide (TPR) repeat protein
MGGSGTVGPRQFGAELAGLMQRAGLSPDDVVRRLRRSGELVGRSSLYDWRNGRHLPDSPDVLLAVVRLCRDAATSRGSATELPHADDEYWKQLLAGAKLARDGQTPGRSPGLATSLRPAAATHGLPADVASFTGRRDELERVLRAPRDRAAGGVVQINAIDGMAGIGKTAFAIHVAHRLSSRYPDGQMFLRLHGHTPGQQPVRPAEALATLLLATGITAQQIPPGLDARQQLWRDRMTGKKVLLVLDDATGSDQVRPLLPGTSDALVLVTSRRRLAALSEALPITLETLAAEEAARLFTRLTGRPGLAEADSGAVAEIVALCGHLPLAVTLMAGQLKHHPRWNVSDLADGLAAARGRLASMKAENISVRAAFDSSYHDLAPGQQQLFRQLGLHPGSDIDAYAAAALVGTDPDTALDRLDDLYSHHLIDEPSRGRYRFHDLIRDHARDLAEEDEPAQRAAATARLLNFYLNAATTAARNIDLRNAFATSPEGPVPPIPDLSTRDKAAAWLSAERLNLHAAITHAADNGLHGIAADTGAAMHEFLIVHGDWEEARDISLLRGASARQLGDRKREADSLLDLGTMEYLVGNSLRANQVNSEVLQLYQDLGDPRGEARALASLVGLSADHTVGTYNRVANDERRILAIYQELGDKLGQADTLLSMGITCGTLGNYADAVACEQRALQLYHEAADPAGEANAINNLGWIHMMTGDISAGLARMKQALQRYRMLGSKRGEASVLIDIGTLRRLTGDYQAAISSHRSSLRLYRELGDRHGEAVALNNLGASLQANGNRRAARLSIEEALEMLHDRYDHGDKLEKAAALNNLGGLLLEFGVPEEAAASYDQALRESREISAPYEEARAYEGMGQCRLLSGQPEDARRMLFQALEIYQRIGSPYTSGAELVVNRIEGSWPRGQGKTPGPPPSGRGMRPGA